ncbi:MAG: UDP-N-acetylmuramoyl-L-alanine--D-glutamate ligase [bacterium]|nr:UDP-N-acetylmuramoyl-L-alanine--D-glutamate ligase [bacterium]
MRVLVLGAAVSGLAAAKVAAVNGAEVAIYDRREIDDPPFETHSGAWNSSLLTGVDLVVTSPGFPEHVGPVPDILASGIPLVSEMEYAAAQMDVPYAAITGTNGKTTVTAVAAEMLQRSGIGALAAGNIGTALSDLVAAPPEMLVIEASSFQLRFIDTFHPAAAAILNIAPDHLDWHTDMAEYVAAKQRIFENQGVDDILVFDADDPGASAAVTTATARLVPVSGSALPDHGGGVDGDELRIAGQAHPNPGLDRAYTMDLIAAGEIAAHLGAISVAIGATIDSFSPGTHRRTTVGTWNDITWVNDSKATNPHAAVASVEAYDSVILIAGGRNKGLDLSPIVKVPGVRRVIGIGEAAAELEAVTPRHQYTGARDLGHAITIADEIAVAGDTVLLAPGCASFDMFDSYAARGEEFGRLVLEKKGDSSGS